MSFIISLIIFFILSIIILFRHTEDQLLNGFWKADTEFCEKAQLEAFILYLDKSSFLTKQGYILAANKDGIIINNPVKLTLSNVITPFPYISNCKKMNATIDWLEFPLEDTDAFPSNFQIDFYPLMGKMIIHQNEIVLAMLWKDCYTSALNTILDEPINKLNDELNDELDDELNDELDGDLN